MAHATSIKSRFNSQYETRRVLRDKAGDRHLHLDTPVDRRSSLRAGKRAGGIVSR